jgi:hypothetical protein
MLRKRELVTPLSREGNKVARPRQSVRLSHAHERPNSAAPNRANPQFTVRNPKSADALFCSRG